ncbi:hypothetical protein ACFLRY_03290 [Bacteroidota bacterium]
MKKTSTLDSFIDRFAEKKEKEFSEYSPSDRLIQNILNYSKISVIKKSQITGMVKFILN